MPSVFQQSSPTLIVCTRERCIENSDRGIVVPLHSFVKNGSPFIPDHAEFRTLDQLLTNCENTVVLACPAVYDREVLERLLPQWLAQAACECRLVASCASPPVRRVLEYTRKGIQIQWIIQGCR